MLGSELEIAYLTIAVSLAAIGPGRFSIAKHRRCCHDTLRNDAHKIPFRAGRSSERRKPRRLPGTGHRPAMSHRPSGRADLSAQTTISG
jgi:hypothetical protein